MNHSTMETMTYQLLLFHVTRRHFIRVHIANMSDDSISHLQQRPAQILFRIVDDLDAVTLFFSVGLDPITTVALQIRIGCDTFIVHIAEMTQSILFELKITMIQMD